MCLASGTATESSAVLVTPRLQTLTCHADVDNGIHIVLVLDPDVDEAFARRQRRERVTEYVVVIAQLDERRSRARMGRHIKEHSRHDDPSQTPSPDHPHRDAK